MSRMNTTSALTLTSGLAALILLFLGGCGFKDDPVPPRQVVPRPITDLRYQLDDRGVTLTWTYPVESVTGRDLSEISSFAVYRAVVPAEEYCPTCPVPFTEPVEIPGGQIPDKGNKIATYSTSLLRPGHMYIFKVRSTAGWWAQSEDSNVVSFLWNIPARAPENLRATGEDGRIVLTWSPVTRHTDGSEASEPIRYRVLRSVGGGAFQPLGEPVADTRFVDTSPVNGRHYYYKVQALSVYDQATVAGGETEPVAAVTVDRTPPAAPVGVRCVRTARTIKVFWEPVQDKDLKGYRVYRRLSGQDRPTLAGEVNAPYVMFTDQHPPTGKGRIFYSVSAIDGQDPANESERSAEVMLK